MVSGLVLTVLCAEEYQFNARDDMAFYETAWAILQGIRWDENILNPTNINEDFRERISDAQFENIKTRLDKLVQHAENALNHKSQEEAAKKHWVKVLGDRFPVIKDDSERSGKSAKVAASGGLLKVGSTSA